MPYNPEDIHVTPMDLGKAAVTVMGVSKRFGAASVLDNINFSVDEDEIVVLLGASGSGKTTILRIIARTRNARLGNDRAATEKCYRAAGA
jgi:ABC-type transporter Mla maintaining outer membrane lipid asymmetry ATPase subunit MlaF